MKFIIVALVACLLLEAVLCAPAKEGGGKCKNKKDGKYPEPGTGCKKYYQCKNKKYQGPYQCPGGQKYDDAKDKCMESSKAKC